MALEDLQNDWLVLLGKDGLDLAVPSLSAGQDVNFLGGFAMEKGLEGSCRYLLSERFEHCGLLDNARENITPVLHAAMHRVMDAAIAADALAGDMDVLVVPSPYRAFGAEVACTPNGYLVMVSPVTLNLCFLYAILAVTSAQATGLMRQGRVVRGRDGEEVIDPLEWVYASHRALSDAVQEYLRTGTIGAPVELVRASRFDLLPRHYIERVQRTYEQMLDFLMLHELGHVALKHVREAGTAQRAVPGAAMAYDAVTPLARQEEQADDFALRCLVGTNTAVELKEFGELLDQGDATVPALDKFWAGRTSIARYTSALQLLKLFDLIEYHQTQIQSGLRFTNVCEINGTHPAAQHRMTRALGASGDLLQLPEGSVFNISSILDWQNWVGIAASHTTREDVLREWQFIEAHQTGASPLGRLRGNMSTAYRDQSD